MSRGYVRKPNENYDLRPDFVMKDPDTGELITGYYRTKEQPKPREYDVGMPVEGAPGLRKYIKIISIGSALILTYLCIAQGWLIG